MNNVVAFPETKCTLECMLDMLKEEEPDTVLTLSIKDGEPLIDMVGNEDLYKLLGMVDMLKDEIKERIYAQT